MAVITIQELQEAQIDAGTIELFSNGTPQLVTPRYGAQFPNMPKLVFDFNAAFYEAQNLRETTFQFDQARREGTFQADQNRRESEFDADQARRHVEFDAFLESTTFENAVDYAPGLVITRSTQVVKYEGALYRPHDEDLPFTTTTWAVDEPMFFPMSNQGLAQFVRPEEFGAVGDGVADDTVAVVNAEAASYVGGRKVLLENNYLISEDIEFRRGFVTHGGASISAASTGGAPVRSVYISRRANIGMLTLNSIILKLSAPAGGLSYLPATVDTLNLNNSYVEVGRSDSITSGYLVKNVKFASGLAKTFPCIRIINANNVEVAGCESEEFATGVEVVPTRSFAASGIVIRDSDFSLCDTPIKLSGTSMFRISRPRVYNCNLVGGNRGPAGASLGAVVGTFCIDLKVYENHIASKNDCVKVQGCLGVDVFDNIMHGHGTSPVLRSTACRRVKFRRNTCYIPNATFAIIVGGSEVNAIVGGLYYKSASFTEEDNTFIGKSYNVKIANTAKVRHRRNRYEGTAAIGANGFVWFAAGSTDIASYDNEYEAPSGTPVFTDVGITYRTTLSDQVLVVKAAPTTSVTAPVITAVDAALNNQKSYVVTFTVGDVKNIKGLENSTTKQKLSAWMATVPGATLGWNTSSWDTATGKLPDVVVDGAIHDQAGLENFYFAQSAMVIDHDGLLTCRDFKFNGVSDSVPLHIGAKSIEELAWQTAFFRSPLVVDGAIYDPSITGIIPDTPFGWDTALAARMCMGQKSDGTFVILAVDSPGCSQKAVATKLLGLGCVNAFNLDGGGSASLWYSGAIINTPSDPGGERAIPAVMYV